MGGVTESLFGGGQAQSQQRISIIPRLPAVTPNITTAGGSFINAGLTTVPGGGGPVGSIQIPGKRNTKIFDTGALSGVDLNIGLAPEIAQLRAEGLGGIRSLLGDVQGDIQTLRGIENPFVQARVQPFVAERERARRDAIRRGVAGPLTSLATNPFQAAIAEQGALATAEAQAAIRQNQELIRALLSDVTGEGQRLLEQELQLLGLGQQQIRDIINSQLERPTTASTTSEQEQQSGLFPGLPEAGKFVGGLLGA